MKKGISSGKELHGTWTALVTPFYRDRVNPGKLSELVTMAVEAKLTGVVPLGSTGESASLEPHEREAVISRAVEATSGKVRVMVGAGTNNTSRTIANIRQAADLEADAVLVVSPYYNKPTTEGLKQHFLTVADASPLPIVLYHIPSRTGGTGIPVDLVIKLSEHPRIIGIKEAGGDFYRSGEIARRTGDDFCVLSGDDPLTLAMMSVGAAGVISVIANISPVKFNRMISLCLAGKFKQALALHNEFSPLFNALSLETNPGPIREAMNILGMQVGKVRLPLAPVRAATRKAIRLALKEYGKIE